tara:strand:- start:222 stop:539 length:318 start_codon:yes stop_codon:yes gene_type:complete
VFLFGIGGLMTVDFFFWEKWATFWIMVGWSMIFGIHYLVFKSQAIDDEWLEEKMLFNVYRLWDYGHIGEIKRNPFGKSVYRTEKGLVKDSDKLEKCNDELPSKKN